MKCYRGQGARVFRALNYPECRTCITVFTRRILSCKETLCAKDAKGAKGAKRAELSRVSTSIRVDKRRMFARKKTLLRYKGIKKIVLRNVLRERS